MRAAPAFQISLRRFAVWRAAVVMLFLLGVSAVAAWLAARDTRLGWSLIAGSTVGLVCLAVVTRSLWRIPPTELRWDGLAWHLARADGEAAVGSITVAVDLGPWMLLRFVRASNHPGAGRVIWLPIQRRGIEIQWHALRCAVYSPRPTVPAASTDAGSEA